MGRSTKAKGEIQGLQFVRAYAVTLVALTHSAAVLGLPEYFNRNSMGDLFAKGAVGVDIFFVLSGFIIVHVSLTPRSLESKYTIGQFLEKRLVRIVPFLWFSVLAYAALRYFAAGEFELAPYVNAAFLLPLGEVRPNVVWSLRHEMLFYVVFAVSFLMSRRFPQLLYAWCLSPVLIWALTFIAPEIVRQELLAFVFNRANLFFGCGVLVGMLCAKYGIPRRLLGWHPRLVGTLLFGATLLAVAVRDLFPALAVAGACTLVIAVGILVPSSSSILSRTWELVGDASYAIYLTHNIFLLGAAAIWTRIFGPVGYEAVMLGAVAGALIFGVGVHILIERPIIGWSRSALRAIRSKIDMRARRTL